MDISNINSSNSSPIENNSYKELYCEARIIKSMGKSKLDGSSENLNINHSPKREIAYDIRFDDLIEFDKVIFQNVILGQIFTRQKQKRRISDAILD